MTRLLLCDQIAVSQMSMGTMQDVLVNVCTPNTITFDAIDIAKNFLVSC